MSNTTPEPGKPNHDGTGNNGEPTTENAPVEFSDAPRDDAAAQDAATSEEFNPDAFRDAVPAEGSEAHDAGNHDAVTHDAAGDDASVGQEHPHHTPEVADHAYAESADTHVLSSSEPTVLTQADLRADEVRAEESTHDGATAVTPVYADSSAPVAPAAAAPVATQQPVTPPRQPVYVQAPTEPKAKGNRGFGILVSLLATVVFAALYAGVIALLVIVNDGSVDPVNDVLIKAPFWIPVLFFFLALVALVSVVNRGGWWAYVIGGFVVAAVVYASYLGGVLIEVAAGISPNEVGEVVQRSLFSPAAVISFVIAREVPVWFGAWVASRGRKVKERNIEARREYERVLDQGPVVS